MRLSGFEPRVLVIGHYMAPTYIFVIFRLTHQSLFFI